MLLGAAQRNTRRRITAFSPRGPRSATGPGPRWRTMTEDARSPRPEPASRRLADGPGAGDARGGRRALAAGAYPARVDAGRSRALPAPRPGAARRARDELAAAGPARSRRSQRGDHRGRSRLRRAARLRRGGGRGARRLPRPELRGRRRSRPLARPRARSPRGRLPPRPPPAGAHAWRHDRRRDPRPGISEPAPPVAAVPRPAGRARPGAPAGLAGRRDAARRRPPAHHGRRVAPRPRPLPPRAAPSPRPPPPVPPAVAPDVVLFPLHDNLGVRRRDIDAPGVDPLKLDLHLPPGRGSLPWGRIAGALRDHGAPLLLEVEPSQRPALPELMAGLLRALAAPPADRVAA